MDEADDQADGETDDRRLHTVSPMPVPELAVPRLWAIAAPTNMPRAKCRRRCRLPAMNSWRRGILRRVRRQAGGNHPKIVHRKSLWATGWPSKPNEAARQGVRNECGGEHGRQPEEQVGVAEEERSRNAPSCRNGCAARRCRL
ncbi:MAG: hypothetical protein ACLSHC_08215 [Bilophila wadsworthia]